MSWFDGDCRPAFEFKQSAYHIWCRDRISVNWDLFHLPRGTDNRLYAAVKARHSANLLIAVRILTIVSLLMLCGVD